MLLGKTYSREVLLDFNALRTEFLFFGTNVGLKRLNDPNVYLVNLGLG
jgi:hypothetical protein